MIKQKSSKNKSSFLILPMLGPDQKYFEWSTLLVNCYVQDNSHPKLLNHIFIEFDYSNAEYDVGIISELENRIFNDLSELLEIKYQKGDSMILGFNVPKEYQSDYDWFRYSKYSKLSPSYKNKVLQFHSDESVPGLIGIFQRSKTMLRNIHKNLGCMNERCRCNHHTYLSCPKFNDFDFDFSKSEVWGVIDDKEFLK